MTTVRACIDCGRLTRNASENRCPEHAARHRAAAQAYTSERRRTVYGPEYQRLRKQVLAEEEVCALCGGEPTEADPLRVDHIVPLAQGGENRRDNLRAAHQSCNTRRPRGPRRALFA